MKYIIILLFIFSTASAQHISSKDIVVSYDAGQVQFVPNTENTFRWYLLQTNAGQELVRFFPDGLIYFTANVQTSNLKDTLFTTTGTVRSPFTLVTLPTTVSATQRAAVIGDILLIWNPNNFTATLTERKYPIVIKRNSNQNTVCEIYEGGVIVWNEFQRAWLNVSASLRLKRITLN
jgi:uncharacterized membrane protein